MLPTHLECEVSLPESVSLPVLSSEEFPNSWDYFTCLIILKIGPFP